MEERLPQPEEMSSLRAGKETIAAYVARPDDARRHAVVVVIPGNFIAELRPGRLPPLFRLGLSGGSMELAFRGTKGSDSVWSARSRPFSGIGNSPQAISTSDSVDA